MIATNQNIIDSLAKSELGRQALVEIEAERSRERIAVLAKLQQEQTELRRRNIEARARADALLPKVIAAFDAHAELAVQLAEIEREASNASFAIDASRGRAVRDLVELGQQAIELTRRRLWNERMALNNTITSFIPVHDDSGKVVGTRPRNQEIVDRLEQIAGYLAELDGLELAEESPAEIEQRCEAMQTHAIAPVKEPRTARIAGVVTGEGKLIRPAAR
jgi:hypothetical protein